MRRCATYIVLFIILTNFAYSEVISGLVNNSKTKEPVVSATVRLLGTNRGTYASAYGIFKLPDVKIGDKIKISSIGYESKVITIKDFEYLRIHLAPSEILTKEALVTANIDVREIIKRAIEQKKKNQKKIKTVEKTLFTKVKFKAGGSLFEIDSSDLEEGDKLSDKEAMKNILAETYSRSYIDYGKKIYRDIIIKRKNTANLRKESNKFSFLKFVNFYDDEIRINNAKFISPLSEDALSEYEYNLKKKKLYNGKYIYMIDFKSDSRAYPGFTGTMGILEGTYELVYVKAKPTYPESIQFINEIVMEQKFEKIDSNYWYPTYMQFTADVELDIISGLVEVSANIEAESIVQNIQINVPLPDSLYKSPDTRVIKVAKGVDSVKEDFWEDKSPFPASKEEKKLYTVIDSMKTVQDSIRGKTDSINTSSISLPIQPYSRLNRVDGFVTGLQTKVSISKYFKPRFFGAYANSSYDWYFGAGFGSQLLDSLRFDLDYSRNSFPLSVNNTSDIQLSSFTSLFTEDYYDWYLADRFTSGLSYKIGGLYLSTNYINELISNTTNKNPTVFYKKSEWRDNRVINEGRFDYFKFSANYINPNRSDESWDYGANANYLIGRDEKENSFNMLFGELSTSIPIISTGYEQGRFSLTLRSGISNNAPPHLLYRMDTKIVWFQIRDKFLSPDYNLYGGSEFLELHTGLGFSDLIWRAVGIPTYKGRGLGLELEFSTGYFGIDKYAIYYGTKDKFYSEIGFNITEIPAFFTSLLEFEVGLRWGIGSLGKGNFGFGLNIKTPFLD